MELSCCHIVEGWWIWSMVKYVSASGCMPKNDMSIECHLAWKNILGNFASYVCWSTLRGSLHYSTMDDFSVNCRNNLGWKLIKAGEVISIIQHIDSSNSIYYIYTYFPNEYLHFICHCFTHTICIYKQSQGTLMIPLPSLLVSIWRCKVVNLDISRNFHSGKLT